MDRLVWLALLLLTMALPLPAAAQTAERCFAETGFCISGPIRAYWEANGGLPVFGFPKTTLTSETVEGVALAVQWFERDRLEIQPDGRVTAGRLGAEILSLQGTPWQFGTVTAAPAECLIFAETGHQLCGGFKEYWQRAGGIERFGYPITGEFNAQVEGNSYAVQYFERRRFEWHPEINGGSVLLGLLGNDVLAARAAGAQPAAAPAPAPAPAPAAPSDQPLVIDGFGKQNFQITLPFNVARVILDNGAPTPWGMRVTNLSGEDELIFADRIGMQNSGLLTGVGETFNVEVKSSTSWKLTIRRFQEDQSLARGYIGTGMGSSDYFWVPAGNHLFYVAYSGGGEGYFDVDLLCSSVGATNLIDVWGVRRISREVPLWLPDTRCSWEVDALDGTFVLGMIR